MNTRHDRTPRSKGPREAVREYRGLTVRRENRWLCMEGQMHSSGDPLGWLGRAGLWKMMRVGEGLRPVFDLPLSILGGPGAGANGGASAAVGACIHWAADTVAGQAPASWQAPGLDEVLSWIDAKDLTLTCGRFTRQGDVIRTDQRLAIRFPILLDPSMSRLPEERAAWLHETLMEGQDAWRMVRIGLRNGGETVTAEAEVDLTGAPDPVIPDLARISLGSIRRAVERLAGVVAFLVDTSAACRAMIEVTPARHKAVERRRHE